MRDGLLRNILTLGFALFLGYLAVLMIRGVVGPGEWIFWEGMPTSARLARSATIFLALLSVPIGTVVFEMILERL